jgi:predicted RNase H-like HicB family nuclease
MNVKYIAFLYKDDEGEAYNINIPDLEGAFSYGDSFEHAVAMAKELLEISIDNPNALPVSHELKYFTPQKLESLDIPIDAIPQVVEYAYPQKKRITVNLTLSALKAIDAYMKSHNLKNRSAFLEDSALKVVSA